MSVDAITEKMRLIISNLCWDSNAELQYDINNLECHIQHQRWLWVVDYRGKHTALLRLHAGVDPQGFHDWLEGRSVWVYHIDMLQGRISKVTLEEASTLIAERPLDLSKLDMPGLVDEVSKLLARHHVEDFAAPINGSVDQRSWREWATIYRQEDNPLMAQFMTDAIERYDDLKHKKVLESSIEF